MTNPPQPEWGPHQPPSTESEAEGLSATPGSFPPPNDVPPTSFPPPSDLPPTSFPPPGEVPPSGAPYPPPSFGQPPVLSASTAIDVPPSGVDYPPLLEYPPIPGYPSGDAGAPAGAYQPGGYPPVAGGYPPPFGGYPPPYGAYSPSKGNSGMAIASLVCSLVGLACYGVPSLVGLVLGIIAMNQIKRTGQEGRGMALAGVIVGAVVVVGYAVLVVIFFAAIASDSSNY